MMGIVDKLQEYMSAKGERSILIRKNILASMAIKIWAVIVQILLVPTTLACLGVYENGVWLTISSVLLWIDNLDIGLGNGLRNKLTESIAQNDMERARKIISSTIAMLVVIILPVLFVLIALEVFGDCYAVFNVNMEIVDNLDTILIATTIMVCMTFVLKFLGNFYMGMQLPAINNMLVTCGNTIALLSTYCVLRSGIHSLLLVAIVNTASPLLTYIVCYPITFYGRYHNLRPSVCYVELTMAKELFSLGFRFFLLQISGIVLFFSSNIIIANMFSPEMVTPYQIAHRYFMVLTVLFTIVGVPFWSATTDAYTKGDFSWIRRSNVMLNRLMCMLAVIVIVMIILSKPVYGIWIAGKAEVPFMMTLIVGIYQLSLLWSTRYSLILNGMGVLKLQLIMTISAAVLYIPVAIFVVHISNSINGLLIVMCMVNVPGLIVNAIQYNKIINGTACGIWKE